MLTVGIMQGRLSPQTKNRIQFFPKESWQEEFGKAKLVGLSHIEWIIEADECETNPIAYDAGLDEIRQVLSESGIGIASVCADLFLDIPYLKASDDKKKELRERLEWLVVQTSKIGAEYIDLPFVDASAIDSRSEFKAVREFVWKALERAEALKIVIALETSLDPKTFHELLSMLSHPCAMANYDTGNSASLGYNCDEEWHAYGSWIRTLHIKDRKLGGGTVPLGKGSTNFKMVFANLVRYEYKGPVVLQAARENDESETAKKNIRFLRDHYKEAVTDGTRTN